MEVGTRSASYISWTAHPHPYVNVRGGSQGEARGRSPHRNNNVMIAVTDSGEGHLPAPPCRRRPSCCWRPWLAISLALAQLASRPHRPGDGRRYLQHRQHRADDVKIDVLTSTTATMMPWPTYRRRRGRNHGTAQLRATRHVDDPARCGPQVADVPTPRQGDRCHALPATPLTARRTLAWPPPWCSARTPPVR